MLCIYADCKLHTKASVKKKNGPLLCRNQPSGSKLWMDHVSSLWFQFSWAFVGMLCVCYDIWAYHPYGTLPYVN